MNGWRCQTRTIITSIFTNADIAFLLLIMLPSSSALGAVEWSGLLRLTSDYEYRGYSLSDDHGAAQINIDFEWSDGFFIGTWVSTADFGGADLVANPYLGKSFVLSPDWQIVTSLAAYLFNDKVQGDNASYVEVSTLLAYRDVGSLNVNIAPDYYGTGETVPSIELELRYPLMDTLEISAGLGYQAGRDAINYDGIYSDIGIAWYVLPYLTLDLRYHDLHELNERQHYYYEPNPLAAHRLDAPVIVSLSIGL